MSEPIWLSLEESLVREILEALDVAADNANELLIKHDLAFGDRLRHQRQLYVDDLSQAKRLAAAILEQYPRLAPLPSLHPSGAGETL